MILPKKAQRTSRQCGKRDRRRFLCWSAVVTCSHKCLRGNWDHNQRSQVGSISPRRLEWLITAEWFQRPSAPALRLSVGRKMAWIYWQWQRPQIEMNFHLYPNLEQHPQNKDHSPRSFRSAKMLGMVLQNFWKKKGDRWRPTLATLDSIPVDGKFEAPRRKIHFVYFRYIEAGRQVRLQSMFRNGIMQNLCRTVPAPYMKKGCSTLFVCLL